MTALVRFEHRAGADEADAVVTVDDDGTVVSQRSDGGPEEGIGWWTGRTDADLLGMLRDALDAPAVGGARGRPSAAGGWTAVTDDGRTRPDTAELAALLSSCTAAATDPLAVLSATAWLADIAGTADVPVLRLAVEGDATVTLRVDSLDTEETLALVTEDGDALGFVGGDIELTAPVALIAAMSGRSAEGASLPLTGTIARNGATIRWRWAVGLGEPS